MGVQLTSGGSGKREIVENNQCGKGTAVEIKWKHARSWWTVFYLIPKEDPPGLTAGFPREEGTRKNPETPAETADMVTFV